MRTWIVIAIFGAIVAASALAYVVTARFGARPVAAPEYPRCAAAPTKLYDVPALTPLVADRGKHGALAELRAGLARCERARVRDAPEGTTELTVLDWEVEDEETGRILRRADFPQAPFPKMLVLVALPAFTKGKGGLKLILWYE
jgi:hypothetical protein